MTSYFSYSTLLLAEPLLSVEEEAEIQQAIDAYDERSWELGLAAGYGVRTNPLVDAGNIPMYGMINIAWFGEQFFFDNGDIGFTVYETDKLSINLMAHVNNERGMFEWLNNSRLGVQLASISAFPSGVVDESIDPDSDPEFDPELDEIDPEFAEIEGVPKSGGHDFPIGNIDFLEAIETTKRSLSADGGVEMIYEDDWGDIQLQILSDISFTHKGFEVWASYAYPWQSGNWKVTPSVGLNWKSHNLLDYYYGVRPEEANFARPAYEASSGFNSFARLSISYRMTDHWGIVGVAEYEALSRSIRRSPFVDRQGIETLFIGIMYNF
jgi:outer membrane protein